ncbi:MAG: hypothetical protein IT384_07350 [Deltaproteobacteria bacterium]|nr:hypothetical protein [Deltaproteobacteria bacterium]
MSLLEALGQEAFSLELCAGVLAFLAFASLVAVIRHARRVTRVEQVIELFREGKTQQARTTLQRNGAAFEAAALALEGIVPSLPIPLIIEPALALLALIALLALPATFIATYAGLLGPVNETVVAGLFVACAITLPASALTLVLLRQLTARGSRALRAAALTALATSAKGSEAPRVVRGKEA